MIATQKEPESLFRIDDYDLEFEYPWVMCRRRAPWADTASSLERLRCCGRYPANFRYVQRDGFVYLFSETPLADGEEKQEGWRRLFHYRLPKKRPSVPAVEDALNEARVIWHGAERGWHARFDEYAQQPIRIRRTERGLRASMPVATWEADEPVNKAIADYFGRFQSGLRFARFEVDRQQIQVTSHALTQSMNFELAVCLRAVAVACRQVSEQIRALLRDDTAQRYLAFHR